MRTRLGRRPSASMVVALIALFVAIGGTATAASKLIITSANVKNQSLTGSDIKTARHREASQEWLLTASRSRRGR